MEADLYGNRYSDDFTIFIRAAEGITSINIASQTVTIAGVSNNDYAFINCKNTLETVSFGTDSQLHEIQG